MTNVFENIQNLNQLQEAIIQTVENPNFNPGYVSLNKAPQYSARDLNSNSRDNTFISIPTFSKGFVQVRLSNPDHRNCLFINFSDNISHFVYGTAELFVKGYKEVNYADYDRFIEQLRRNTPYGTAYDLILSPVFNKLYVHPEAR